MKLIPHRVTMSLLAACLICQGCKKTPDTSKPATANVAPSKKAEKLVASSRNDDVAFQSFVTRLRQAVHAKDVETIASMMTTDFGYHLDPPGEGPGVFSYWDQDNIWPELELVLKEPFVSNSVGSSSQYMVAPPEFVASPDSYVGYRAGIVLQDGTWKFAYFVSGQAKE